MISYEEAFRIVLEKRKNYGMPFPDIYTDYAGAYCFSHDRGEDAPTIIGGPESPLAVLKENGKVMPLSAYILKNLGKGIGPFHEYRIDKEGNIIEELELED